MKRSLFLSITMTGCFLATQAQKDSTKLYQKIDKLFISMGMADILSNGANTAAEQTIKSSPSLMVRNVEAKAFFTRYIGWPGFKKDLARIYATYYTSSEIDDLIRFYQTPAGKKTMTNTAQLQQEVVNAQSAKLQTHVEELNQLAKPLNVDSTAGFPSSLKDTTYTIEGPIDNL